MLISLQHIFTALNVLLLLLHRNAIPRRDVIMCGIGVVAIHIASKYKAQNIVLEKTMRFRILLQVITGVGLIFTIILPWWFIVLDSQNAHLMAPHLFVSQAQIALESSIIPKASALLVFWFMFISTAYRALPLAAWVSETRAKAQDQPMLVTILPGVAVFLWICTSLFMCFEWYPLLRSQQISTMKKKE